MSHYVVISKLLVCASALALSGCAALNPGIEPDAVMPQLDGEINIQPYLKNAGTLNANQCNALNEQFSDTVKMEEFGRLAIYAHCASLYEAQAIKVTSKANPATMDRKDNPWMMPLAQQSFRLIRGSCEAYFDRIERRRVRVQYHQNNINVGIGAVTAVLAAVSTHTRAIFNLATVATAGNAATENYKANFILTPELAKLHDKIKSELFDPKESEIASKAKDKNYEAYGELISDLAELEDMCSHKKLVQWVAKAIDITKFEFENPQMSPQSVAEANSITAALTKAGGFDDAPTLNEFMNLAALAEFDEANRKKIVTYLDTKPDGSNSNAQVKDKADSVSVLVPLLNQSKALSLHEAKGAPNIRLLNRLADTYKWHKQAAFETRQAKLEVLSLSTPTSAAEPAAKPAIAGAANAAAKKAPAGAPVTQASQAGFSSVFSKLPPALSTTTSGKINFQVKVTPKTASDASR